VKKFECIKQMTSLHSLSYKSFVKITSCYQTKISQMSVNAACGSQHFLSSENGKTVVESLRTGNLLPHTDMLYKLLSKKLITTSTSKNFCIIVYWLLPHTVI